MEREYKRFTFTYGIVMLRTKRGLSLMDALGRRRITRPLAWFMLYLAPISAGIALYLIFSEVLVYLGPRGAATASYVRTISPLANLLLPGVNPYVPIIYGWIAIVIAIVIHEAAHGIVARSLGIPVKTAGLVLLFFIPIGAFVEVDETQMREVKPSYSLRVLAAGSGINLIVGVACLALLLISVNAMVPAANGSAIVGVAQDTNGPSPALKAGVTPGDFIVAVNGVPNNDLSNAGLQPYQMVNLTVWRNGQTIALPPVQLGEVIIENTQTGQNTTAPYLGVNYIPYQGLTGTVTTYLHFYSQSLVLYVIPPAFPGVEYKVPFSAQLSIFYTSPLGGLTPVVQNLLFWVFFVNFNLAIFNNLPIYPLDGGQSFERFLVGIGKGKINDDISNRIAVSVTLILAFILVSVVVGPYLAGYL